MYTATPPDEVLLLGPGPSPLSPKVRDALRRPLLGHLDPDFLTEVEQLQRDLRRLWGADRPFTLPLSATGSGGMEACLLNLVEPGDRTVVGVHGVFGQRLAEMARRAGADVVEVASEFGQPLDGDAMAAAIARHRPRVVALVHAETSTGVLIDPQPVCAAAAAADALVVLDCVTSLGGVRVALDEWGVDVAYSGSQKCLAAPPGLSPVSVSERALDRVRRRTAPLPTWYFDFRLLAGYFGAERRYHHTAPTGMVVALGAAVAEVLAEGIEARERRHRAAAAALGRGLAALGLSQAVAEAHRLPMITTVLIPHGVDDAGVRLALRRRWGVEIGGGLGPMQGRQWRIGLMGHGARVENVALVLTALARETGRGDRLDAALEAAGCVRPAQLANRMADDH